MCGSLVPDALADLLDKRHGAGVADSGICAALTQHYEQEFHADMQALNVGVVCDG